MAKQQIHQARLKITRQITIPQYEEGGVVIELRAHGKHIGEVTFSGAHVYFRHGASHYKVWNFSQFVDLLKRN